MFVKDIAASLSTEYCKISRKIFNEVMKTSGKYMKSISNIPSEKITSDTLNPSKSILQAHILEQFVSLKNKKVLEVGSGYGVNHIVWRKKYGIDGYGIEPDSEGFESSYKISKELIKINNLDSSRIINAPGEKIPFHDKFFDIVYSTNVLEHVNDPYQVLDEALRVLKPQGIMQIVYPNYYAYFDGHYAIFIPPLFHKALLPFFVEKIYKRDPSFARTLRIELNIGWTKKSLKKLSKKYHFKVLSLGEKVFFDRMVSANFESWAGLYKIKKIIAFLKFIRVNRFLARFLMLLRSWNPIILTIQKLD
jgi:ubiquinone/menaquinone biosynthesis C-methylase UbiE